jgi:purine-nucleoside phosphorylase
MSTVPEIIASAQLGLDCVVLTMITNLAAGLQGPLSHVEVFEEAKKAGPRLAALIKEIVLKIDSSRPSNVRIKDEVSNDGAFESFPFK